MDSDIRQLEKQVLAGDSAALAKLRMAYVRIDEGEFLARLLANEPQYPPEGRYWAAIKRTVAGRNARSENYVAMTVEVVRVLRNKKTIKKGEHFVFLFREHSPTVGEFQYLVERALGLPLEGILQEHLDALRDRVICVDGVRVMTHQGREFTRSRIVRVVDLAEYATWLGFTVDKKRIEEMEDLVRNDQAQS